MVSQARNGKRVKTMWRLIWFSPLWYAHAERSIDWFGTHSTCRTSFPHIEWHKVRIVTSTQIWCFTSCDGSLTNAADSMCAPKHAVQFLWVCGLQPTESLFESIIGCHKMLWNAAMLCTPLLAYSQQPRRPRHALQYEPGSRLPAPRLVFDQRIEQRPVLCRFQGLCPYHDHVITILSTVSVCVLEGFQLLCTHFSFFFSLHRFDSFLHVLA